MKQAHIFISGLVQGVGFRYFVRSEAQKLRLTGWVANMPDGRVEAVVEGSKQNIEKLVELCDRGTYLADVKNVVVEWEESESNFTDFEIRK